MFNIKLFKIKQMEVLMKGCLLLRHVRLTDGCLGDILIEDGKIARTAPVISPSQDMPVLEGDGGVVCPGFVNAHIHPGQTFVGGPWVDYAYADTVPGRARAEAEYQSTHPRMNAARNCFVQFREAIRRGTTHVRGHMDVGSFGLEEMEDALYAREAFRDVLDIEYVAMPSNGILNMATDPAQTIPAAVRLGAEGIGGADPCDRDGDPVRSVELTCRLAAETGAKVDLHLHEFGAMGLFSMHLLFAGIRKYHLEHRVTISHAWCLANVSDETFRPIAENMRELGIGIITHVPGHVPFPSLKQMQRFHVPYGVGTDNMRNLWSPYGMNDMRERVMLLAYLSDFRRREDLEAAYDAGTYGSAQIMRFADYGLQPGCRADLVVFSAENRAEALLQCAMPHFVIKRGRLVARDGVLEDCVPEYKPC